MIIRIRYFISRVLNKIVIILENFIEKIIVLEKKNSEKTNIIRKKHLIKKYKLSSIDKEKIKLNFKKYRIKCSCDWHKLYASYNNKLDLNYFPEIIFATQLEFKLNPRYICKVLSDKALVELLYKDIENLYFPKTLILNCSGIFYDKNRNIISKNEAIDIINNYGKCLIKTTLGSNSGKSIKICNFVKGIDTNTNLSVKKILDQYSCNYIVQECIENCKELKEIYSNSLNTIRVITYIANDQLYHSPIALRVGGNGSVVDNVHAGGMSIGVSDDGLLTKYAFREYGEKFDSHPDSNVVFENYKIPKIDEIINIAYKCHARTPHLNMISWDFTIDKNNKINLIEVNINRQSIWFPQYNNSKSIFGENTEYMYKKILKSKKRKGRLK